MDMGDGAPMVHGPKAHCAAESSHCTVMVAVTGTVAEVTTEPVPEGKPPPKLFAEFKCCSQL
jgi:hypothetical protein